MALVCRAGHPLARAARIDFDLLRRGAWVLSRRGAPARDLLERFFLAAGQAPPIPAVETGDLAVLRGLLLESDMVTAISAHQLRYEIRDQTLIVLDFPLDGTRREIGIASAKAVRPRPGARPDGRDPRPGRGLCGFPHARGRRTRPRGPRPIHERPAASARVTASAPAPAPGRRWLRARRRPPPRGWSRRA
jgi:hypothetical protein